MDSKSALLDFFEKTLHKNYARRYKELLETKKGSEKLYHDLWHVLGDRFRDDKVTNDFSKQVWSLSAYAYGQDIGFGTKVETMEKAYEEIGHGSIIIDTNGNYGIYKPEDYIDDIKFYKA